MMPPDFHLESLSGMYFRLAIEYAREKLSRVVMTEGLGSIRPGFWAPKDAHGIRWVRRLRNERYQGILATPFSAVQSQGRSGRGP